MRMVIMEDLTDMPKDRKLKFLGLSETKCTEEGEKVVRGGGSCFGVETMR